MTDPRKFTPHPIAAASNSGIILVYATFGIFGFAMGFLAAWLLWG